MLARSRVCLLHSVGLFLLSVAGCQRDVTPVAAGPAAPATQSRSHSAPTTAAAIHPLVAAARGQIGVTTSYDPAYRTLAYPNGDVAMSTGVCSDVVVRAFRVQKIDLQQKLHEDMAAHFSEYPRKWGLTRPDRNIDHRRVLNLMTYFKRQGCEMPIASKPDAYAPGDVVAWDLTGKGLTHIGIVSDGKSPDGVPLIIHNMGRGTREEDILLKYTIIGHYKVAAVPAR